MARLVLRQEAINDLTDIWEYTSETWSENQADKYYQAIKSACIDISNKPSLGKTYEEISSKVLGYSINKHIIFYHEASADEIEVVRILHERMDLKRHLK
ncbi:MAG: type II toxin-antitoxin system RelE/ParE family toxin [Reichenbachiella sp.]|uniref:type II toxin-antitoxin system RelE/ParE family toxin n=1 Tax=Reichenbachiella sp. TaxID=2184521 RepID=UPI0029663273|nr:type II toxin-antitoxin system RelE/ParE family toxin [Reichenbachiella sp.]MDW3209405.1 type II toxin-antitoxin system RelE/ParE family toxin [Reichenbachiella sp.]